MANHPVVITSTAAQASGSVLELPGVIGSTTLDTATGVISFTDADLTDVHTVVSVVPRGAGYLGSLTLGAISDSTGGVTGSVGWTFSVPDGALDFLAAGQTLVQSYAVTIGDGHGGAATQLVTVTLTGTNDVPVITSTATASGSVTELAGATGSTALDTATGALTFTDADLIDKHAVVSVVPHGAGYLGSFTLGALSDSTGGVTGSVPWSFSVRDGALDFLAAGQTLVQSYDVTIGDGHGVASRTTQTVTVTLTGTNDVPVIAGVSSGVVTEDVAVVAGNLAAKGALTIVDADLGQSSFIAQVGTAGSSGLGTFSLDTAGHWTYTASNAQISIQQLGAGQSLTDSFTATSLDGTQTQLVTVTINGTNDVPVIGGVKTGAVTEDVAVVAGNLATGGTLTIADVDLSQSSFVAQAGTAGSSGLGTFTLDTAGHWTYTANDAQIAIQQLGIGQSVTDSFTATSLDGTKTQLVTVTIKGANDVPVMTSTAAQVSGSITEQAGVTGSLAADTVSGTIAFTDDLNDVHTIVSVVPQGTGYRGSFTLGALSDSTGGVTGSVPWTFSVADGALDFLAAGQTLVQTYAVTISDGHGVASRATQTVTVTLTGTNDVPVIAGVSTGAVTEDVAVVAGNLATSGALTIVDPDLGQSSFIAQAGTAGSSGLGTFNLDAAGHWTYKAIDAQIAIQQLGAGQSLTDSFTATSLDGTQTQLVTVTINGTNDVSVIGGVKTGVVTEDVAVVAGKLATSGTLTIADVDLGQSSFVAQAATAGSSGLGTFTLDTAGHWTYAANDAQAAIQHLGIGQSLTDSFTATSLDGSKTQLVTVTIKGANDPVVIPVVTTSLAAEPFGSITEQAGITGSAAVDTTSGTIAFTDADLADVHTASVVPQGAGYLGSFTLGALSDSTGGVTGSVPWTFSVVDGALDFLADGQTLVQSYAVAIGDGHGGTATQTVTMTINGANDAPVAQAITGTADEHGPPVTLIANFSDVDVSDTHTVDLGLSNTLGSVTAQVVNHQVVFSYDPNGQFASLAQGDTATDSFTYTVVDNGGLIATATATVTIVGQNDAPVANADTISVGAGATTGDLSATLLANDTDVDTAHSLLTITSVNTTGTFGTVTLDPITHSLTYTAPAIAGPDSFQYTVSDGQGGTSTATVSVNPDHLVTDNWLVTEGRIATFSAASVLSNDTAFDGGALTLVSVTGAHVAFSQATGLITYTAPTSDPTGLGDVFTYTTSDSLGRLATGTVDVSLWDGRTTPVLGDNSIGNDTSQAEWLFAAPSSGPWIMTGGAGADRLIGSNVAVPGSDSGDVLIGGGGADTLLGGLGNDHFAYIYGGVSAPNRDSSLAAMDTINDFTHSQGAFSQEVIELDGFNFTAASTTAITATIKSGGFTKSDQAGYFADGNVVHVEALASQPASAQVYIDANQSGSFEAASDIVIHLNHLTQALVSSDFQFN